MTARLILYLGLGYATSSTLGGIFLGVELNTIGFASVNILVFSMIVAARA